MLAEIDESDGKILRVVFEKRKKSIEEHLLLEKKMREERRLYKKRAIELANETIKKKIAVICAEFDKSKERKKKRIVNIAKEVKKANTRENVITEKFLGDVENMVVHFKEELDKMQELFGSIIKRLPQVQFDTVVKAC